MPVPGCGGGATGPAVLEFRRDRPTNQRLGSNLVITLADHKIVAMMEYRRAARAHQLANVAA